MTSHAATETSVTDTADRTADHNPLAPTHSRPAHPHKKPPSRRLLKKQGRLAPAATQNARQAARRAPREGHAVRTSAAALIVPLAAITALAFVIRRATHH